MQYPIFEKIIHELKKNSDKVSQMYRQGVDLTQITDPLHQVISYSLGAHFGQEGLDWIDWWCYDKDFGSRGDLKAYDSSGNEICKTIYDLWETIEDCRANNPGYSLKNPLTDEERQQLINSLFKSL